MWASEEKKEEKSTPMMGSPSDRSLFDFLLTQKSAKHKLAYDMLETIIAESIEFVKRACINAKITNFILNIDEKLVLAQVYVERKNAFAPVASSIFGTSPTAYNVQVRFPFGLEARLGPETVFLPNGDFIGVLDSYVNSNRAISDDVQRDSKPEDIICGPASQKTISEQKFEEKRDVKQRVGGKVSLAIPNGESISFTFHDRVEPGFSVIPLTTKIEYSDKQKHDRQLKIDGVYPLFYSSRFEEKEQKNLLREHKYSASSEDYADYVNSLKKMNDEISDTSPSVSARWAKAIRQSSSAKRNEYLFDITIINGMTLLTKSSLPLTRLYGHQVELFKNCMDFITALKGNSRERAGKISMGVGAGKTFFVFTLLLHLQNTYRGQLKTEPKSQVNPPFCMAPDEGVANVTKKSINRQGMTTGTKAASITTNNQMPSPVFLRLYQTIANQAKTDAEKAYRYIQEELQTEILEFCQEKNLHFFTIINLICSIYFDYTDALLCFKDSIDIKRLILLVEGQKLLLDKTGMGALEALNNLLEQFTAIENGILQDEKFKRYFCAAKNANEDKHTLPKINYNQSVSTIVGNNSTEIHVNIASITPEKLKHILTIKNRGTLRTIRDSLIRIACLANKNAAIILANSGGLGNTQTKKVLEEQIETFLPIAATQLTTLAAKKSFTAFDYSTMNFYLGELFASIPDKIQLNHNLQNNEAKKDAFKHFLYGESLRENIALVTHIKGKIQQKIETFKKVSDIQQDKEILHSLGLQGSDNAIQAAQQLATIASLQVTESTAGNNLELLLTHIPVFTPEGLACYFEHLSGLITQPKTTFQEKYGIYTLAQSGKISQKDIENRLTQILNGIMIADEVHKEAFNFLYDTKNAIYKRINTITLKFLRKNFIEILPARIGMTGTANDVTDKAFPGITLYDLSIQRMIKSELTKKINVAQKSIPFEEQKEEKEEEQQCADPNKNYAMQIVTDYFSEATELLNVSKGLIFSKTSNEGLNKKILSFFNLLIKEDLSRQEKADQDNLFFMINKKREEKIKLRKDNLSKLDNRSPRIMEEKEIKLSHGEQKEIKQGSNEPLTVKKLREIHRETFCNNLFAIYLEYVLSKSNAPKEFSDIIGLQNELHGKGFSLINGIRQKADILKLINQVDKTLITEEDIRKFITVRIKDSEILELMVDAISASKNNQDLFIGKLNEFQVTLDHLATDQRDEFESGKTFVMLGGPAEQTGYSHEPVGIVVEAPSNKDNMARIDCYIQKLQFKTIQDHDIPEFLFCLQTLVENTFSYDEKNQVGGRALRTPYGDVQYIQYQTKINAFITESNLAPNSPLRALKIETEFSDIFIEEEMIAKEERMSVMFNRAALALLTPINSNFPAFQKAVEAQFSDALKGTLRRKYENFIHERLPFLWAMRYRPEIVLNYFSKHENTVFTEIRKTTKSFPSFSDEKQAFAGPTFNANSFLQDESRGRLGSLIPPADEKIINKVHSKLLGLTKAYLANIPPENLIRGSIIQSKHDAFDPLKKILEDVSKGKRDCLEKFLAELNKIDKNIIGIHRTNEWIRYFYNALSILSVIPGLFRAFHSYSSYGTFQFWKPTSEKTLMALNIELHDQGIFVDV